MGSASTITSILELLATLTATVAFITIVMCYVQGTGTKYDYLSSIAQNWSRGPITSASGSLNSCPYDQQPLINDFWPGTETGCKNGDTLRKGGCGKHGKTISEQPPLNYTYWRGVNLCSKRMSSSYFDLSIAKNSNACPKNTRSCGVVDSLKNVLCIPKVQECPFNYMEIIPSGQPMPSGFNFVTISLKDGATLILSNVDTNGKIILDFLVSEDTPCADPYYKNYIYPPYILEKYFERDKCYEKLPVSGLQFDLQYELKDSYSYYKVYAENNVLNAMSLLPNFTEYSQNLQISMRTMKLFYRNYVGIQADCVSKLKENGLSDIIVNEMKNLEDKFSVTSTIALIALIFGAIGVFCFYIYIVLVIISCLNNECEDSDDQKVRFLIIIIPQFFSLIVLVLSGVIVGQIYGVNESYRELVNLNCVDSDFLQILVNSSSDVSSLKVYSMSTFILSIVTLLLYGFQGFIAFCA